MCVEIFPSLREFNRMADNKLCYIQWVRMDYGLWILKWIWNGLPKSIIHMDYGFFMDFQPKTYGFFMDLKSIWIMDLGF